MQYLASSDNEVPLNPLVHHYSGGFLKWVVASNHPKLDHFSRETYPHFRTPPFVAIPLQPPTVPQDLGHWDIILPTIPSALGPAPLPRAGDAIEQIGSARH